MAKSPFCKILEKYLLESLKWECVSKLGREGIENYLNNDFITYSDAAVMHDIIMERLSKIKRNLHDPVNAKKLRKILILLELDTPSK